MPVPKSTQTPPTDVGNAPPALCPACGRTATQAHLRDLSPTEHEGTYCDGEHIWQTKWFAAVGA